MDGRWNDDRLDDLARGAERRFTELWQTADRHTNELRDVGVLKEQMSTLSAALKDTRVEVRALTKQLGQVADEPLKRAADFWRQVRIGVLIAFGGGAATLFGAYLAGAIH